MTDLNTAAAALEKFRGESFRQTVAALEARCSGTSSRLLLEKLAAGCVSEALLSAALLMKKQSRQINEIVHAAGVLLSLPNILEPGEVVESLSLAAGNTGRGFDLSIDRRIAEFTFIHWQGGPESIRQHKIFKDFYFLAEDESAKRKELFTIGTDIPMRFFESERSLKSILSNSGKLGGAFTAKYRNRFTVVRDYFEFRRARVKLCDVTGAVPLFGSALAGEALE